MEDSFLEKFPAASEDDMGPNDNVNGYLDSYEPISNDAADPGETAGQIEGQSSDAPPETAPPEDGGQEGTPAKGPVPYQRFQELVHEKNNLREELDKKNEFISRIQEQLIKNPGQVTQQHQPDPAMGYQQQAQQQRGYGPPQYVPEKYHGAYHERPQMFDLMHEMVSHEIAPLVEFRAELERKIMENQQLQELHSVSAPVLGEHGLDENTQAGKIMIKDITSRFIPFMENPGLNSLPPELRHEFMTAKYREIVNAVKKDYAVFGQMGEPTKPLESTPTGKQLENAVPAVSRLPGSGVSTPSERAEISKQYRNGGLSFEEYLSRLGKT